MSSGTMTSRRTDAGRPSAISASARREARSSSIGAAAIHLTSETRSAALRRRETRVLAAAYVRSVSPVGIGPRDQKTRRSDSAGRRTARLHVPSATTNSGGRAPGDSPKSVSSCLPDGERERSVSEPRSSTPASSPARIEERRRGARRTVASRIAVDRVCALPFRRCPP